MLVNNIYRLQKIMVINFSYIYNTNCHILTHDLRQQQVTAFRFFFARPVSC